MKFAIAIILFAFEASSIVMSGQIPMASNLKNLGGVKRCSSVPHSEPCTLTITDESSQKAVVDDKKPEDVNRSKRSVCFCTVEGCGCTFLEHTENVNLLRSKRNAYEVQSALGQPKVLNRKKRQSCACGRHGCFCDNLDDLGDQYVQVSNSYSSSAHSSSSSTSSSSSFTYYG